MLPVAIHAHPIQRQFSFVDVPELASPSLDSRRSDCGFFLVAGKVTEQCFLRAVLLAALSYLWLLKLRLAIAGTAAFF